MAVILMESAKKICALSKEYGVYSELYNLHDDTVREIYGMKPIFPGIEDLKELKRLITGIQNDKIDETVVYVMMVLMIHFDLRFS